MFARRAMFGDDQGHAAECMHSRAHGWLDVCTGAGARSRSDVLVRRRRLCACAASDSTAESKKFLVIGQLHDNAARPG
jgi:hypothetical protein